jgi:hypothetical protein
MRGWLRVSIRRCISALPMIRGRIESHAVALDQFVRSRSSSGKYDYLPSRILPGSSTGFEFFTADYLCRLAIARGPDI